LNYRMQQELTRIIGKSSGSEAEDASTVPVKVKSPKPKQQARPRSAPAVGVSRRLDAAYQAVTASVEGLKTVSTEKFAQDQGMRACARSLGAVLTQFVKLHKQLEPSLTASRPTAHTIISGQASCTHQSLQSPRLVGSSAQRRARVSADSAVSHPQMPVAGFFGSASLQSKGSFERKGSGLSCTEVLSAHVSLGAIATVHSDFIQAEQADATNCNTHGTQDGANVHHDPSARDESMAEGVARPVLLFAPEPAPEQPSEHVEPHEVPPQRVPISGDGDPVTTHSAQPPSSVLSDMLHAASSQTAKTSACSARRAISQTAHLPAGAF
jgi:hypothetical protein